jgi:hypothetical protein
MFLLIPFLFPQIAGQTRANTEADERILREVSTALRRIADAFERNLESDDAELRLKKVEVAARVLQVHWERIGRLRGAAENAEEAANSAEEQEKLLLADLENLEERERELKSLEEGLDPEQVRARNQELREERNRLEAYIEQTKERAWRLRDQVSLLTSELEMVLSRVEHLEEIVMRWLEELE